ncbi:MAG: hypothetical protein ACOX2M_01670 [Fastidiosipilaceae bacterium]|jgi:hypothetical protein
MGTERTDRIERVMIDYHKAVTVNRLEMDTDDVPTLNWNYFERLLIDRGTQRINHMQRHGQGCVITRDFYVEDGVSDLLDHPDLSSLVDSLVTVSPDPPTDISETNYFMITVDFAHAPHRVAEGIYDRRDLPERWPEFMRLISSFMDFYEPGEILNSEVYCKAHRRNGEYVFCAVRLKLDDTFGYFRAHDEMIEVGDYVLVPTAGGGEAVARVMDIDFFTKENAPFPFEMAPQVIRGCTAEELERLDI